MIGVKATKEWVDWEYCLKRYPRLLSALQDHAIASVTEAACGIRDHRNGFRGGRDEDPRLTMGGGEVFTWSGLGVTWWIREVWRCRHHTLSWVLDRKYLTEGVKKWLAS